MPLLLQTFVMPRLLPLKIQIEILDHVNWDGWYPNESSRTLASCRLVCKAWSRICQRKLLKTVIILDHQRLERLVAFLSSATRPHSRSSPSSYVYMLFFNANTRNVAPLYLATKLPFLRCLVIFLNEDTPPFIIHSSLVMHLRHFRTVVALVLDVILFQSFSDFRRLISSLPALYFLSLNKVDLLDSSPLQKPNGKIHSPFTFPQNLTDLQVHVLSGWNPLWIWITPYRARNRKPADPYLCPLLSLHDADAIWESAKSVSMDDGDGIDSRFKWSFDKDRQQCWYFIFALRQDISHDGPS